MLDIDDVFAASDLVVDAGDAHATAAQAYFQLEQPQIKAAIKSRRSSTPRSRNSVSPPWSGKQHAAYVQHVSSYCALFSAKLSVAAATMVSSQALSSLSIPTMLESFDSFLSGLSQQPQLVSIRASDCSEIGEGIIPGDGFCLFWCLTAMRLLQSGERRLDSLGLDVPEAATALGATLDVLRQSEVEAPSCGWDLLRAKLDSKTALNSDLWGTDDMLERVHADQFGRVLLWEQQVADGPACLRKIVPAGDWCTPTAPIGVLIPFLQSNPHSLSIVNRGSGHFYFMTHGDKLMTGDRLHGVLMGALRELRENMSAALRATDAADDL